MIINDWKDVLRCSSCGSPYEVFNDELICSTCDARFPIVDGIPLLLKETTIATALEQIDYDAVHGITDQVIRTTGVEWKRIIKESGAEPGDALEIGAGTGALTLGLLEEKAVRRLTATDVSHKFLRMIALRAEACTMPISLVACDANEPHFRANAFDLVLGRSILHHLLDYDATLRQCYAMLKPGGVALFFEPVIEGKAVLTLLMALLVRCDENSPEPRLSATDRQRVRGIIRHQMKAKLYPQDRESLARLEDKYIFEVESLKNVGREAGFSEVEFLNSHEGKFDYWSNVVRILRRTGIPQERYQPYKWIAEEFANTHGVMFADRLVTPMGYFVFRKLKKN